MPEEVVTFIADWSQAEPGECDCCGHRRDVLTFAAEPDTVVDLCRSCAVALATNHPTPEEESE